MAPARDLYVILGVGREASADEIKRAYRQLARQHHPDVNGSPDAERRFKEIAGAYEILSDPDRRRQYDAFGEGGPGGSPFGDVQDIFDMFFGGGGFGGVGARRARANRTRTERGEDVFVSVQLEFEEAAFGAHRDFEIDKLEVCERCLGNGSEPGSAPTGCRSCGGTGVLQEVRRSIFGQLMTSRVCDACQGTGLEITDPCRTCSGDGRVPVRRTVPVDIPPGVADGIELRVAAGGHAGRAGGPAGDLYVSLRVSPNPVFERRGQDLVAALDISMVQASLGADVEIDTLDGVEAVHIESGTESGVVLRLKGRGIPNLNRRGRGDLFLTVHVRVPGDLKRKEKELLRQLAELRGEDVEKGATSKGSLRHPTGG
jgi:molecular chaperone DnaJ